MTGICCVIRSRASVIETPQHFFLRVSCGLAGDGA